MKEYIIESLESSDQLAVLDNGELEMLIIDDKIDAKKEKNIYRGRIQKVIASMNACFVDIGEDKPGYLKIPVGKKLLEGDNIMVQISKEEKNDKRVKLSSEISLSGRYLVYIPSNTKLAFSSKIKDKNEKSRLNEALLKLTDGEKGFIIRSEAQGVGLDELKKDLGELRKKYIHICEEYSKSFYPKLLYKSDGKVVEYIKENFNDNISRIVYLDGDLDRKIRDVVKSVNPKYLERLKREKNIDLFESYGINFMLKKYISKNVWLKNGAYIVIDRTEAMTVIDVNTGRFRGNSKYEDTVYDANIVAAKEIARQIMMRDITGIIIVDFIDMKDSKHRRGLLEYMRECLDLERRRSTVYGYTHLGLMEISRMRKGKSIDDYFRSDSYLLDRLERRVMFEKYHNSGTSVRSEIATDIYEKNKKIIEKIKDKYGIDILP